MSKDYSKYTISYNYEQRLAKYDIEGSIAHSKMLSKQNIITEKEFAIIQKGLLTVLSEIDNQQFIWKPELEDIHMNIEFRLTELIGEVGSKLHTARSRNDQISLDMRMYIKDLNILAINKLILLINKLVEVSEENSDIIMPGYTHLQRAQPILLSHHLLAYAEMFLRDIDRYLDSYKRADVMPLGSGALAGLPYDLDREFVAKELGFSSLSNNSIDTVSDRDFILDYSYASSTTMMHISRFSEEIIIWSSEEFGFTNLGKQFTTWSSIMPQKRNPDFAELARGKTGRVYGDLFRLFTILKGLPLAYNRDMQEDKEGFFDIADTLNLTLEIFSDMIGSLTFNKSKMLKAVENSYVLATDIADYLVSKSVPFRQAHKIVSEMTDFCIKEKKYFSELELKDYKSFSEKFDKDIFDITPLYSVNKRDTYGGTSENQIKNNIANIKSRIKLIEKQII
ncbi:MAG: argininosuccinate lyase [Chloroflexi bacterium]|nr:argininosuccinate lyase [Chloroflexota bacterium]|tara:strand:- start:425 stop:1780 length:1356 start_codon:yes stop_codon:yes gene_type:complete